VAFNTETIKGMEYAIFAGTAGDYVVSYLVPGDNDGDGFAPPEDCDDTDDTIFPGAPELCDGEDDDCDDQVDEDFTDLGTVCSVGVGECEDSGVYVCTGDQLGTECDATPGTPNTELCDGLDNDCDGALDEDFPDLGTGCSVGVGECTASGVRICAGDGTGTECNAIPGTPTAELCDGLDNDCDGSVDEDTSGGACITGQLGACAAGTEQCQSGTLICVQNTPPTAEACNGIDDDCDGEVDEDNPGGGGACTTGQLGVCNEGTFQCQGGVLQCVAPTGSPEVCDGADNDCDGQVDEDTGGGSCDTGEPGECATGSEECQGGTLVCVAPSPTAELCGNALDEDCDGEADEVDCSFCLAENTVTAAAQTKRTIVRLKDSSDADKIITRGTFVLPAPGAIAPDTQQVRVRVSDGAGTYYEGTIPANQFEVAGSGSRFKFKDPTLAHDGIEQAKFSIKRKDGVTTKYLFKARGLNQPAFVAGTGTMTLQVGERCFVDPVEVCVPKGSGARCE
jgi:hypothetical protein